ncbi:MAG: diadenosine tetraphosphatase [Ignavibacteriales bacterium CG12_big_fil_rev_8_21_14_0_65_30_8]|nr:MAG: diadenosine tetraphosphatase [Ignavibacteriales bacterium CG12_big_fil_rev_8_21_14_0_65_30_8]
MIAVISDVHGCVNTLKSLVKKVEKKYPKIPLYCVGDLVDRGNFGFETVEYVISKKIKFVPGNHELMFYHFMKNPFSDMGRNWIYNGYETTILSYDEHHDKLDKHLQIIEKTSMFYNLDDCFLSHAGISIEFENEIIVDGKLDIDKLENVVKENILKENSIVWTRNKLVNLGKLQIVGHTRKDEVQFDKKSNTYYIDTSAYAGNKLTAVIIDKNKLIDTIQEFTDEKDLIDF